MKTMLVDANNILIRGVRAGERSGLSTSDGVPTSGLLFFINSLSHHLREEEPDAVVVCWDGGQSRVRLGLYPDYKKKRRQRPKDDALEGHFELAKTFLSLANLHHVERDGVEADDLIARYWRMARPEDEMVILSSDHDLLQLVGPGATQVKVSSRPPDDRWTAERVLADLGCDPRHLPYVMALQGDPGDDVPGLPGIGPKKAVKMMAAHEWSWLRLLACDGTEKVGKHEPLDDGQREVVQLALRLVDLRDGPGPMGLLLPRPGVLCPTAAGDALYEPLLAFLRRYELASVERRVVDGTLWPARAALSVSDFPL